MILFAKITKLLGKILLLLCIITFEKVVGHPVLFLTFSLAFLLTANTLSKYVLFLIIALFLSVLFNQTLILSLLIIFFFYFGFKYGSRVTESNLHRFIGLLLTAILVVQFSASIQLSAWTVAYFGISIALSVLFLVKVLFVTYGFLGENVTTKQSFLR